MTAPQLAAAQAWTRWALLDTCPCPRRTSICPPFHAGDGIRPRRGRRRPPGQGGPGGADPGRRRAAGPQAALRGPSGPDAQNSRVFALGCCLEGAYSPLLFLGVTGPIDKVLGFGANDHLSHVEGEGIDDLRPFDAEAFADALFAEGGAAGAAGSKKA